MKTRRHQVSSIGTWALAAACALLVGCSTPQAKKSGYSAYSSLYDGKSEVAHATQMPVGSAQEAELKGDNALALGDVDRALFDYIRALEKGGDDPDVLFKIGTIHAARKNTKLAEYAFRWALKEDSKHAGSLAGLGILLMNQRKYAEARSQLAAAVRINRKLARAHNALGVLADMEGDHKEAQGHYEDALAVVGDSAEILNNVGYSRYMSGNRKGAIAAFKEALSVDPGYEKAWRNLGLVYARNRQYDKALEAFSKVEDMPKAYNDVGYVAMVSGRLKDAEKFFDEAMITSPQYYELAASNAQRLRTMKGSRKVVSR